tara:strand:- start:8928 stop:9578 length:651 start_codon:yes stop_codon:yes gene_type:complete
MNYQITPLSSLSNVLIIAWVAITGICYYALVAMDLKVVTSEFGVVENILYTEHGFIENLQVILLILACTGFIYTIRNSEQYSRDIAQFLALLMIAFIVRELGIDAISDTKLILFEGDGRLLYAVPLTGLMLKALLNYKFYLKHLNVFLGTRSFQYLGLAAIFYGVISRIFEKNYMQIANQGFWEESTEIAACLLLFAIGCRTIGPDLKNIRAEIDG